MRKLWFVALIVIICIGAWCRRTALYAGFWSDDYAQYAMLHGDYPLPREPWDLFRFSDGSRAEMQRHIDFGSFPYWSDPHFKLALLRPLASLSHALDYRYSGTDAFRHHLHSFLWWALSVVSVSLCLRRCFSWPIALLALLMYALDEAHSIPLAWLANRSPLMAAALGFAALAAHQAYREQPRWPMRLLSIVLFAGALACGEYALSMLGYFAALELLTAAPRSRRLHYFAPFLGLSVLFIVGSTLLGYGSGGSGIYVSPMSEPMRFVSKLIVGVPVLSADLLLTMPADLWTFGATNGEPGILHSLHLVGGVLAPLLGALLWYAARPALSRAEADNARWLAVGAWLSLVPVSGSFITTRLCVVGSVGAAALVASSVIGIARRLPVLRWYTRLAGVVVMLGSLGLHTLRAPSLSMDMSGFVALFAHLDTASALSLQLDPVRAAQQRVIQVSAVDANNASYFPFVRDLYQRPMPRQYRVLSLLALPQRLRRVSDNSIELSFDLPDGLPNVFRAVLTRGADPLLTPGAVFQTQGMLAHVLEVRSGAPTRVQFDFDVSVDDPSLVFVEATELGLQRVVVPPLGQTIQLAAPRRPKLSIAFPDTAH